MKQCKLFHTMPSHMAFFVCSCKYLHADIFDNLLINNMYNTLLHTQRKASFNRKLFSGNNPKPCWPQLEFNALKAEILTQFGTIKSKIVWPRLDPFLPHQPLCPFRPLAQCALSASNGKLSSSLTAFPKGDPEHATCHWRRPLPYQLYNSFRAYISCA